VLTLGLAEYRQGHFPEAAAQAAKALAASEQNASCQAQACAVLALAQQQLKQAEMARTTLANGQKILQSKLPNVQSGDLGPLWEQDIAAHLLIQEAQALIEAPGVAK
jgi:hypothetical protein